MSFDTIILGALVAIIVVAAAGLIFAMVMGAWVIWRSRP